jgi:uncharacterized repeat protein (TIGR01451 family)
MRIAVLVAFIWIPFVSSAVTVSISVIQPPLCYYDNGILHANANGGIGPYTYLWSNGATTETVYQITADFYSVTVTDANSEEATAQINVPSSDYGEIGDPFNRNALCWIGGLGGPGSGNGEILFLDPAFIFVVGPEPYTMDGELMYNFGATNVFAYNLIDPVPGSLMTLDFLDGMGCPGTYTHLVGYPPEWSSVTILDVQGSCASGANGSVTIQTGLEGHSQGMQTSLKRIDEVDPPFLAPSGYSTGYEINTLTFSNLEPGDWYVHQTPPVGYGQYHCFDTTFVHVPDLGNTCGDLNGMVYLDANGSCTQQGGEPLVQGQVLEILPGPIYTIASTGSYSVNVPNGSYTVEQQPTNYFDNCNTAPVPFTFSPTDGAETINFGDSSLVPLDAGITMASGAARPGFQMQYGISTSNLSPQVTGANTVSMTYDPLLSFVSATPTPTMNAGNVLTWNIAGLGAFQQRSIQVFFQIPPDIALLGTTLDAYATLASVNIDGDLTNNSVSFPVVVTGAYDPNDKLAKTNSSNSSTSFLIGDDEWLDYTIRFQNTGTDTAFNIVITDTIAGVLDLGTFRAGASSHPYSVSIRDGNVLRFAFYNIQLPDSNVNEPRSHGFVSFRIVPHLPLLPGTEIENIANIYFDFNPPVITEPSVLTAEFSTAAQERANGQEQLVLLPNPATDHLRISSEGTMRNILIIAADGREVLRVSPNTQSSLIDVSGLSAGPYVVLSTLYDGTLQRGRFIKQ